MGDTSIARDIAKSVLRDGCYQSYLALGEPVWLHDRLLRESNRESNGNRQCILSLKNDVVILSCLASVANFSIFIILFPNLFGYDYSRTLRKTILPKNS